jgi:G3E family GTPase
VIVLVETPAPDARVPVVLLSGFLGAGKTTLVRRWLTDFPSTGRKLGVVMNEFGAVSIDSLLVSKPDLPVVDVDGGCLCCAPDAELSRAMHQLVREHGCDLVVIEPSGLADPLATLDALTEPDELGRFEVRAVVAVVDAQAYARVEGDAGHWPLLRDQMRFADWILISKCDVVPEEVTVRLEATGRSLHPGVRMRRLPANPPGLAELIANEPPIRELPAERGAGVATSHEHLRYRSVTFRFPLALGRREFEEFLRDLDRREVVRAKGFVRFTGQGDRIFLFQSVFGHFLIDEYPAKFAPEPVAVLIGPALDPVKYTARLQRLVWGKVPGGSGLGAE